MKNLLGKALNVVRIIPLIFLKLLNQLDDFLINLLGKKDKTVDDKLI